MSNPILLQAEGEDTRVQLVDIQHSLPRRRLCQTTSAVILTVHRAAMMKREQSD